MRGRLPENRRQTLRTAPKNKQAAVFIGKTRLFLAAVLGGAGQYWGVEGGKGEVGGEPGMRGILGRLRFVSWRCFSGCGQPLPRPWRS
jgi:hypothetical protein